MPLAAKLASLWNTLFRKARIEKDLSDELQGYVDELIERKVRAGMKPDAARQQALIEVGGVEQTRELVRETRVGFGVDLWLKDILYALRGFRRTPGFVLIIVLTLALGIGAVTSVFSIVDAALLRKLPVDKPDELVLIGQSGDINLYSSAEFENVRRNVQTLANAFAFGPFPQALVEMDGQRSRVTGQLVTGNYYSELGVRAFAGRTITEDDDRTSAEPVAVITYRYWNRRFNLDPNVIGKKGLISLRQNAEIPVTIVGVSAPDFNGTSGFGSSPDFSIARSAAIQQDSVYGRDYPARWGDYEHVHIMSRLQPGVSSQRIAAEIRVKRRSGIAIPESMVEALHGSRGAVSPALLMEGAFGSPRSAPVLPLLAAAFALLLLIGCVNVSNLLFSRSIARRREIGIRWVLGAGRSRLIRQLLTETVMLSFLGGAIGVFFAYLSQDLLVIYVGSLLGPNPVSLQGELVADLNVNTAMLAFTAGVSLLTGILFGIALALRTSKMNLHAAVKDGGPNLSYTRSRLRKALLVAQVAMSLVLVMSGGVFFRTLHDRFSVDPGFDTSHLITVVTTPPKRPTSDLWNLHYKDVLDRVRAVPGVASATLWKQDLERNVFLVEPDFFETMGIPLLSGRDFTADDKLTEPRVAIITERKARRLYPNRNPLGEDVPGEERRTTIIGVVKEAQLTTVPGRLVDVFQLNPIGGPGERAIVEVRSVGDPKVLLVPLQKAVSELNPAAQVFAITYRDLWEANMSMVYAPEIALSGALNVFGVIALFMISVGLYGITAYNVASRTGEIGIRMALGARRRAIVWLVQKEMLGIVAAGTLFGLGASVPLMMLIRRGMFGLAPNDPATLLFAVLAVLGVGTLAAWLPTRRATRVDPMVSLRIE